MNGVVINEVIPLNGSDSSPQTKQPSPIPLTLVIAYIRYVRFQTVVTPIEL